MDLNELHINGLLKNDHHYAHPKGSLATFVLGAEELPSADLLIHSGDVAKVGSESELGDFNQWLWSIQHKFRHILVISGESKKNQWSLMQFRGGAVLSIGWRIASQVRGTSK